MHRVQVTRIAFDLPKAQAGMAFDLPKAKDKAK